MCLACVGPGESFEGLWTILWRERGVGGIHEPKHAACMRGPCQSTFPGSLPRMSAAGVLRNVPLAQAGSHTFGAML